MSIEDDKPAQIDPSAVAQLVVQEFQRQSGRQATPQERDYIADLAGGLKGQGYDDETTVGYLMTAKAAEKIVDQKIRAEKMSMAAGRLQDRASAIIDASMRVASKEDKKFKKIEMAVRAEVQNRFNNDPVLGRQWNSGLLDEDALEDLCDTIKDEFYEQVFEVEKTKNGVATGAKPKDKSPEAPALEGGSAGSGKVGDVDKLDDHQQAHYYSQVSNLQRYGNKTEAEAEKIAFERASKLNVKEMYSSNPRNTR